MIIAMISLWCAIVVFIVLLTLGEWANEIMHETGIHDHTSLCKYCNRVMSRNMVACNRSEVCEACQPLVQD